jgi:hypothetical protein
LLFQCLFFLFSHTSGRRSKTCCPPESEAATGSSSTGSVLGRLVAHW